MGGLQQEMMPAIRGCHIRFCWACVCFRWRRFHGSCISLADTLGFHADPSLQGWPIHEEAIPISKGQTLAVTTDPTASASSQLLPITYPGFAAMCSPGDTLFVGRYLVNGADQSSLYLEVKDVKGGEVVCEAQNDALLDGLLTVIHSERSDDVGMSNMQVSS